jgi:cold-inducible RNA-binding protein
MGTKLYVGNLSYDSTEGDVRRHFEQAGQVSTCDLIMDKFTNKSKGFAFVEMSGEEEAQKAISMFDNEDLDGRSLKVNEARPREDRGRSYGGGGGDGGGGGRRERY